MQNSWIVSLSSSVIVCFLFLLSEVVKACVCDASQHVITCFLFVFFGERLSLSHVWTFLLLQGSPSLFLFGPHRLLQPCSALKPHCHFKSTQGESDYPASSLPDLSLHSGGRHNY